MGQAVSVRRVRVERLLAVLAALPCWLGLPLSTPCHRLLAASPPTTRAALADQDRATDEAVQLLIDQACHLHLTAGPSLAAVVAHSTGDDRTVRRMILERCQRGQTYRWPRGDLEVDVWLPTSDLNDLLREILRPRLPQPTSVPVNWSRSSPPALLATGRCSPAGRPRDSHPGWRYCDARQIALAEAAAVIDARANLLDRIGYLHLAGEQQLGFLLQRYAPFRRALAERISKVGTSEPVLEPTGLCRVTIVVPSRGVLDFLKESSRAMGEEPLPVDVTQVTDLPASGALTAEGFAVAPPAIVSDLALVKRLHDPNRPAWADRLLVAQAGGQAPADIGDEQARQAWAARAARIEATRQLWMQLEDLPMPNGETISARMARDLTAVAALANADKFIFSASTPVITADGSTTVGVGIHLQIVWRMLRGLDQPTP